MGTRGCSSDERDQGGHRPGHDQERTAQPGAEEGPSARTLQSQKKADIVADFLPKTIGRFKAVLADLTTVTQHQEDKARGILRGLMGGQTVLQPTANGNERFLTAEVSGTMPDCTGW